MGLTYSTGYSHPYRRVSGVYYQNPSAISDSDYYWYSRIMDDGYVDYGYWNYNTPLPSTYVNWKPIGRGGRNFVTNYHQQHYGNYKPRKRTIVFSHPLKHST